MSLSEPPASPLEPQLALVNRVLIGGLDGVLVPPRPTRRPKKAASPYYFSGCNLAASRGPVGAGSPAVRFPFAI